MLTEAVQDRLVASGGALGEWWAPSGPAPAISKGPVSPPAYSFGNANVWARGFDQFGTATAQAASAGVGYNINRAAPFIAGVDWRFDNNIVAGGRDEQGLREGLIRWQLTNFNLHASICFDLNVEISKRSPN